jgi:hypothetical protein
MPPRMKSWRNALLSNAVSDFSRNAHLYADGARTSEMKLFFRERSTPVRACELCLLPMKFLGDHAEFRLFRCESCALVSTENAEPESGLALARRAGVSLHY